MADINVDFKVKNGLVVAGTATLPTVAISGGTINSVTIGGTTPGAATFSTLNATTSNLGTVSSGTWNGSVIPIAKGGTGVTTQGDLAALVMPTTSGNAGKYLTNDGASSIYWSTVSSTSTAIGSTIKSTRKTFTVNTTQYNTASANVNTTNETITVSAHPFLNDDEVTYSTAGTIIGGLTSGNTYYVREVSGSTFKLASLPASVVSGGSITTAGTGYTNGTYNNVKLYYYGTGGNGLGATANITVSGGIVTGVTIVSRGVNYTNGDQLGCLASAVGGTGTGFKYTITTPTAIDLTTQGVGTHNFQRTSKYTCGAYEKSKNQVRVYVNGVRQFDSTYTEVSVTGDYSQEITLSENPANGETVFFEIDGYYDYGLTASDVILAPVAGMAAERMQSGIEELNSIKAPIASPTFTGAPLSTTPSVDDNTTKIATTAYVIGQAASATPNSIASSGSVGTAIKWARSDHTHSGVTSITGTINQVTASASNGAVTLSLPQNIHTGATPTFSTLTTSGNLGAGITPTYRLHVDNGGTSGSKFFKFQGTGLASLFGYGDSGGSGITNSDPYSSGSMVYLAGTIAYFYSGTTYLSWNGTAFFPADNNSKDLGGTSNRWSTVYSRYLNVNDDISIVNTTSGFEPWLTINTSSGLSSDSGGISIGESGKKGAAALHLTYTGDGFGHIGMGSVTSGVPQYRGIRFQYTSSQVYFDARPNFAGNTPIDSGNIGSQSVNYASTAGSAPASDVYAWAKAVSKPSYSASEVGLGNVTNESKSTMFSNPTFTGTVSGVSATHVGLGSVTNESKSTMLSSLNNVLRRTSPITGYLDGGYPSIETLTGTPGCIYTIGGGSYNPTSTTLGNMYGIGYGYSGTAGITATGAPSSKWGLYVASSGTSRIFLNSDDGNGYFNGTVYSGGNACLTTGTYNSYAPTLNGVGAVGTWGISITGSAGSAATAGTATSATSATYCSISTGRTDNAWYQAMWTVAGSSSLYSTANVTINSGYNGYGGIGVNGSGWILYGHGSYGWAANTGIYCTTLYSTGNVYAYYSDERLKDVKGPISDAYDIIDGLEGFRYTENELARSFGYNNKKVQFGISAQKAKQVAPEVVSLAAFDVEKDSPETPMEDAKSKSGEDYLTVDYAHLVPVLIEYVKQLRSEVETLKTELKVIKEFK